MRGTRVAWSLLLAMSGVASAAGFWLTRAPFPTSPFCKTYGCVQIGKVQNKPSGYFPTRTYRYSLKKSYHTLEVDYQLETKVLIGITLNMASVPLSSEDVNMARALVKFTLGLTYDPGQFKTCFGQAFKNYGGVGDTSSGEELLAGGEGFGIKCYIKPSGNYSKASLWIFAPD